ncbi:uncharacterized protein TRIADDRAFT_61079 [Trichoplax adhaerens]|uniref:adenosine deaminase n=1 Tax=Trichoplax adhaerens TaxID=10228 RepID=B3S9Z4_TRIAD|nr:hypothetical protein TRIADDRAFT_61079 [Trichoplax adhaerens]EDV20422.1 hypothetical protein TRIADDRAFT_61079 [Trichoplax adhaerens]|eukprot:XP_002117116.1 hypothetical protein TRIADDRAFT_61079 [Trichoplax adhaerens]
MAADTVELHNHLDGSIRAETIIELARNKGAELPFDNVRQLKELVSCENVDVKDRSLRRFLEPFPVFLSVVRGDAAALRRCAIEFCEDQANEGVLYTEVRYAPQLLSSEASNTIQNTDQLTDEGALQVILEGLAEGSRRYGITVRSLLCCIRPFPELSAKTAELCKKFHGKGVVGIDLAGDEGNYPIKPDDEFVKAFQEVKKFGIHRTAHAGEAGPAESIRQSLDWLSAERIGHGYHLVEDEKLFNRVKNEKIHLELCPTSSLLTGSCHSFTGHPAKRFIDQGLNFSLNCDCSLSCNVGVADEYDLVYNDWGYDIPILTRAAFNAARSCFLPEEEKKQLIADLERIHGLRC